MRNILFLLVIFATTTPELFGRQAVDGNLESNSCTSVSDCPSGFACSQEGACVAEGSKLFRVNPQIDGCVHSGCETDADCPNCTQGCVHDTFAWYCN